MIYVCGVYTICARDHNPPDSPFGGKSAGTGTGTGTGDMATRSKLSSIFKGFDAYIHTYADGK